MLRQLTLDEFLRTGRYNFEDRKPSEAQFAADVQASNDEALFNQFVDSLEILDPPYNIPAVLRHINANKTFQPEVLAKIDRPLLDGICFESRHLGTSP